MSSPNSKSVLEFLYLVNSLKHTKRTGWVYREVKNPESIASHMYSMGVMTFLLGNNTDLDRFKCLQLALIHDLAECIVGDIAPCNNVPKDLKHTMELKAMTELAAHLPEETGKIIVDIYVEYEKQETAEAKFVKDLDRFDMILTASFYERSENSHGRLQDFFDSTEGKLEHPLIKQLAGELIDQRNKHIQHTHCS